MPGTAAGAAKARALRQARLASSSNVPEPAGSARTYVVGRKPIKMGEAVLQPGEEIPGAHSWLRLESWLRTGAVVER